MKKLTFSVLLGIISLGIKAQTDTAATPTVVVDSCYCAVPAFSYSEKMPEFPGGKAAFERYLMNKANNQQGVGSFVYIEFTVSETGKVCNARVAKGIAGMPSLDRRALKIIQESPPWTPGVMNGKNVCVKMTVPVRMPPPAPR